MKDKKVLTVEINEFGAKALSSILVQRRGDLLIWKAGTQESVLKYAKQGDHILTLFEDRTVSRTTYGGKLKGSQLGAAMAESVFFGVEALSVEEVIEWATCEDMLSREVFINHWLDWLGDALQALSVVPHFTRTFSLKDANDLIRRSSKSDRHEQLEKIADYSLVCMKALTVPLDQHDV
ncbi:hypothetical protein [Enterovibrio norvegicus]|uniref:hypothetical protein n=1 Tax=Enterovibrio norvegicus TaxID=188144 RepID=UPI0024B0EBFB|nr:hypothetical protein [Enterovibrio norvegicus]